MLYPLSHRGTTTRGVKRQAGFETAYYSWELFGQKNVDKKKRDTTTGVVEFDALDLLPTELLQQLAKKGSTPRSRGPTCECSLGRVVKAHA